MKTLFAVTVAAITVSMTAQADFEIDKARSRSSAQAQGLPDPVTCGQSFRTPVRIRHSGMFSAFGAYTTTIDLGVRGQFSVTTNDGLNQTNTVNAFTLRDINNTGLMGIGNHRYNCGRSSQQCAVSAQSTIDFVNSALERSYASGPARETQISAIACLRSIALTSVRRAQQTSAGLAVDPVQPLTQSQALETANTMRSLLASHRAQQAADAAQATATAAQTQATIQQINAINNMSAVGRR